MRRRVPEGLGGRGAQSETRAWGRIREDITEKSYILKVLENTYYYFFIIAFSLLPHNLSPKYNIHFNQ